MDLDEIVAAIRGFPGITRKNAIHSIVESLPTDGFPSVGAAAGEDAAAISFGDHYILFAADGIMESLVKADPFLAGYFAVLVNVNDIAAMGGRPMGMVDVISSGSADGCPEIIRGMRYGIDKFAVPIVGGHTHPDCGYESVDISIVGSVLKGDLVRSDRAAPGDDVVFVMDLDGSFPEKLPNAWVTTIDKDDGLVRAQMEAMCTVAAERLVHSGKDMSNPGSVGTLGMMLECSGAGADVDIGRIPIPDGVGLRQWLLAYQGCGFVFACPPENSARVIEIFSGVGCAGAVVGKVSEGDILRVSMDGESRVLFDFSKDSITGIKPRR